MDLTEAIDGLYRVFARYELPSEIDMCDHCVDPADLRALHGVPLRELTEAALMSYASNLFLVGGSDQDFRYFLPRLVELTTLGELWYHGTRLVRYLGQGTWTPRERTAIDDFLLVWWRATLADVRADPSAEDVLEAISAADAEPGRYLEALEEATTEAGVDNLSELVWAWTGGRPFLPDGWKPVYDAWMHGPHPLEVFVGNPDHPRAEHVVSHW